MARLLGARSDIVARSEDRATAEWSKTLEKQLNRIVERSRLGA